jgi:septal ring factor EnvC (AmiA/AmiB activator)
MSRDTLARLARRAAVVVGTIAVIGVAAGTVRVAADWRSASAPLDAAPVSMATINDAAAVEQGRAADITAQMDGVAQQVSSLQAALITASGGVTSDTTNAQGLQDQLAAAKAKLTSVQKQLKAAQIRLQDLNKAAARQAALNRRITTTTRTTSRTAPAAAPRGVTGD